MVLLLEILSRCIDIQSFVFMMLACGTAIVVTRGTQKVHFLEGLRRVALPIGTIGSIMGYMMILHNLSDPTAIWPAFQVMMLSSVYGLGLYLFSTFRLSKIDPQHLQGVVRPSKRGMLIFGGLWMLWGLNHIELPWIDMTSVFVFAMGLPILSIIRPHKPAYSFMYYLASNSVILSLLVVLYSVTTLYFKSDDPTMIGPSLSLMFCSLLYGGVIFSLASLVLHKKFRSSLLWWHHTYAVVGISMPIGTFLWLEYAIF